MANPDSAAERTEAATPKRLAEARRKGDVARSRELDTALTLTVSLVGLAGFGPAAVDHYLAGTATRWRMDRAHLFEPSHMPRALISAILDALYMVSPFLVLMMVATLSGPFLMGGFVIGGLKVELGRMNPLKGIGRMFSAHSAGELVKSLAKVVLCALAAWLVGAWGYERWLSLGASALRPGLSASFVLVFGMIAALTFVLVVIAVADVPWQKFQHAKKLRMTREEVKREHKESTGNPEQRARMRGEQMRAGQQRMLQEVATANVIVTNPTHYAVALRYRDGDAAPVVVAKGVDEMAQRIRALGADADVPSVAAAPLARALFHHTRVGEAVRDDLWQAVAQVLAFVVQLERVATTRRRAGERRRIPVPPTDTELAVPRRLSDPEPFAGDA